MSALRDDNRRLSSTVSELRSEKRMQERKMRDLQRQLDLVRADQVSPMIDGIPNLPVEVANPERPVSSTEARVVAVTDDGEEIVYEGDAAAGKIATLEDDAPRVSTRPPPPKAAEDRFEVTPRRTPTVAARRGRRMATRERPSDRDGDAAGEYRAAVELVRSGQHEPAVAALRAFIGKHPRHDYADNAQYWLGETFYAAKDYPHALTEFRNVVETYPRGNKVPDALLKVGYCYQSMGQTEKARAVLEQVVSLYPKTEPAALAAKRLETP
jgi:tol-pal system protein YbgF